MSVGRSDAALALVAERGFEPGNGARRLRGTVERMVLDPLARGMLGHGLRERAHVRVDAAGDELVFEKAESVAA